MSDPANRRNKRVQAPRPSTLLASSDARGAPTMQVAAAMSLVSREDMQHALHTHFQLQASAALKATAQTQQPTALAPTSPANIGRKRVHAFLRVQKNKISLTSKRLFGGALSTQSAASKFYILCVTVQENRIANAAAVAQLHYLQMRSSFAVDVRQTWNLGMLQCIENNAHAAATKRGAFALCFQDEDAPWEWLVEDAEDATAMLAFVWSLCALLIQQRKSLPRLVRFNLEELHDVSIQLNLPQRYGIDVDLLDQLEVERKKTLQDSAMPDGIGFAQIGGESNSTKQAAVTDGEKVATSQRLTAIENEDAAVVLASVNWSETPLDAVEADLKNRLKALEEDNIAFLLSFEGDSRSTALSSASGKKMQPGVAVPVTVGNISNARFPTASQSATAPVTSVDKIIAAISALQVRVDQLQGWTNQSNEFFEKTSTNMKHVETLNNQLEVHFKNSVALQDTLRGMIEAVEIPRENMSVLLRPVNIFPSDVGVSRIPEDAASADTTSDWHTNLKATVASIQRVDQAIRSTALSPACDMVAFRSRGEELVRLARAFCDKLCAFFDGFLQSQVRQWAGQIQAATATSPGKPFDASGRETREVSSARRSYTASTAEMSRISRTLTSMDMVEAREVDWSFTSGPFHSALAAYEQVFEHLESLDANGMSAMRQVYVRNVSAVYNAHVSALFRCLREKLPKISKHHFSKPQAMQSWSFHLSSTQVADALGASPLLQQGLDHLVPILTQEQQHVAGLFFHSKNKSAEMDQVTGMMEGIFDKLQKRICEFGEIAAARNILDALALVVLVGARLEPFQQQCPFFYNVLVSFQLQLKRVLLKFTEDQESWINSHHPETRMAGVLSPISKTLTMVSRLEDCVCGKVDDATLASIYNRILPSTIQWLEHVSESKPKYLSLTRLENYLFIFERLHAINPAASSPLSQYAAQAHTQYEANLRTYIAFMWEYEWKQVATLFNRIEELEATLPVDEIVYHVSRQEFRQVLESIASSFEKSVKSIHDRMKKHFTANPKTLAVVWSAFMEYATTRLAKYDKIASESYQLHLDPPVARIHEVLSRFEGCPSPK